MEQRDSKSAWVPIVPIPDDCPASPPDTHPRRGKPLERYLYYSADGEPGGWVYEYLDSHNLPVQLPLVWAMDSVSGDRMWRFMSFPEPRPLYRVLDIPRWHLSAPAQAESPYLLILPSEKAVDAAVLAFSGKTLRLNPDNSECFMEGLPCVTWAGGPGCALKADWSPVKALRVVIWPEYSCKRKALTKAEGAGGVDPDSRPFLKALHQPGIRAAGKIAERLKTQGCEVWIMQIPEPGAEYPDWGIVDVIASGMEGQALWDYIHSRLERFSPSLTGTDKPLPSVAVQLDETVGGISTAGDACAIQPKDLDWQWLKRLFKKDDKIVDCRENVYFYLNFHPDLKKRIWADEFSKKIIMRKPMPWVNGSGFEEREWTTTDECQLGLWLGENEKLLIKHQGTISSSINWLASEHRYNPAIEYFESLKWDGVERLDFWLSDFMGSDRNAYTSLAGRMFLIAVVARVFKPGCLMRTMPIFEGTQYRGKSTALRILGGKWFADTPLDFSGKDFYQNISGKMIYEISELEGFSKADVTRMKAVISSPSDRFRAPYEARPTDIMRQTVFVGTTNQSEYFRDHSGNTRYWPIAVETTGEIRLDALADVRDQLFAEAVVAFKNGEHWWPSAEQQIELFEPEQQLRELPDGLRELIEGYLNSIASIRVTTSQILVEGLKMDAAKIASDNQRLATAVGNVMKRMGWKKSRPMENGVRVYYYERPNVLDSKQAVNDYMYEDDGF